MTLQISGDTRTSAENKNSKHVRYPPLIAPLSIMLTLLQCRMHKLKTCSSLKPGNLNVPVTWSPAGLILNPALSPWGCQPVLAPGSLSSGQPDHQSSQNELYFIQVQTSKRRFKWIRFGNIPCVYISHKVTETPCFCNRKEKRKSIKLEGSTHWFRQDEASLTKSKPDLQTVRRFFLSTATFRADILFDTSPIAIAACT